MLNKRYDQWTPDEIASLWERWCGITPWSRAMRDFGAHGGRVHYFGGLPRSASAIRLCFTLILPNGEKLPDQQSRLCDIKRGIEACQASDCGYVRDPGQ